MVNECFIIKRIEYTRPRKEMQAVKQFVFNFYTKFFKEMSEIF